MSAHRKAWLAIVLHVTSAPCVSACGSSASASPCAAGMVLVPAGTFVMGVPVELSVYNEAPEHAVTLSSFCIDRTEVTALAYSHCDAPGCAAPDAQVGPYCAKVARSPTHPRNCIRWDQARAYCAWRGGRLPTEAEWEYAARGPRGFHYPWGEAPPDRSRARYGGDFVGQYPKTAPVGSHPRGQSPFGIDDMAGNVSEWVADWIAPYRADPQTNPRGPEHGSCRGLRGGAYDITDVSARDLAGWSRGCSNPELRTLRATTGFRCVADPR